MTRRTVHRWSAIGGGLVLLGGLAVVAVPASLGRTGAGDGPEPDGVENLIVFGFNDLGMHCMNEDFSEVVILPPFNNLRAQVIRRGSSPDIIHGGDATVSFTIPSNTRSADKTNFWTYAEDIFGAPMAPDVGLTGSGMSGAMAPAPGRIYEVTGIPITPIDDSGRLNPYPLARITAVRDGMVATTEAVVPVSSELTCNLCHQADGVSTATDILRDHDVLHGTDLEAQKPVLCASCHADVALGQPGLPGLPNLSLAVHGAHAPRMDMIKIDNECYACHPGIRTQCQRDIHLANGVSCTECHGGMLSVGDPARQPWLDQPRCGDCHDRPGFDFEQPGVLYKDSIGHGGVHCATCHGSPHAITPTTTDTDNLQALVKQGFPGVISACAVCHSEIPGEPFFHRVDD